MGRPAARQTIVRQQTHAVPPRARAPLAARRDRGIAAGLAGALLTFLALTTVQALTISAYLPPDELYHVSYAVAVGDGHLPTLTTPVPAGEIPLMHDDGRPRRIYTANHPPLFYLPESVALRIGSPAVSLLAGALALRRGPTGWRMAGLDAAAAAAALTRAPGLVLVGVAGLVAAAAVWLHSRRPPRGRLLAAAGAGALVGGASLASSIWFYLRNRALYGEFTGSHYNQALFGFPTQDHPARLAASPAYVLHLFDDLWVWTHFAARQIPVERSLVLVPRAIALAVLAGLVVAGCRRLRGRLRRPRGRPGGAPHLAPPGDLASWLLPVAWTALTFLMGAWYDGNGGHTHARYLLPAIGVVAIGAAIGAAIGLDALPGARRGLTILAVSVTLLALTGFAYSRFAEAVASAGAPPSPAPRAVALMLHQHGVAHPWLLWRRRRCWCWPGSPCNRAACGCWPPNACASSTRCREPTPNPRRTRVSANSSIAEQIR